jgi:hypothetical protein
MRRDRVDKEVRMDKTRKPYRRPTLTVYGDLRDITQTTTGAGSVMDMTTGMNKST